ncbi:MAG: hypothetical protein IT186_06575 [Acidobacteria bacterium]|nr:hypothetical protein [Acidobacteriota bacterium]
MTTVTTERKAAPGGGGGEKASDVRVTAKDGGIAGGPHSGISLVFALFDILGISNSAKAQASEKG